MAKVTYLWARRSPWHEWHARRRPSPVESRTLRRLAAQTRVLWWSACRPGWRDGSKDLTPVHACTHTHWTTATHCSSHAHPDLADQLQKPLLLSWHRLANETCLGTKSRAQTPGQNPLWQNTPATIPLGICRFVVRQKKPRSNTYKHLTAPECDTNIVLVGRFSWP